MRRLLLLLALPACLSSERAAEVITAGPVALPPRPAPASEGEPRGARWPTGEGPVELSVEDAVLLALEHNQDLQVQRLTPEITGAFERIASGAFHPEVFAETDYFAEDSSEVARSTGTRFDVSGQASSTRMGIRQRLPFGTEVEGSVEHRFNVSSRTPEQQASRVGLSLTQSLLRGFGPGVDLAELRAAELDTAASIYELRGFTEAVVADTEILYWRYVLANRAIEIYERALAVARRQLAEVEERVAVGRLAELDAHASRAEVALREQALIDARSEREAARLRLLRMVGPPEALDAQLEAISDLGEAGPSVDDVPERVELALRSRPDLKEAMLRQEQRRLQTVVTRNGLLPRLDVFVALGKTGFASSFNDAFLRIADDDTFDFTAGLRIDYLLGAAIPGGRHDAAYAAHRQAAEAVENLQQIIALDVRLAANEVERARQQIAATAATRAMQERSAEAEAERFAVGKGTALSVAQAQRDLLASQLAEVEAIVAYREALVRLHLAEGTLLQRRGLVLEEQEGRGLP